MGPALSGGGGGARGVYTRDDRPVHLESPACVVKITDYPPTHQSGQQSLQTHQYGALFLLMH